MNVFYLRKNWYVMYNISGECHRNFESGDIDMTELKLLISLILYFFAALYYIWSMICLTCLIFIVCWTTNNDGWLKIKTLHKGICDIISCKYDVLLISKA